MKPYGYERRDKLECPYGCCVGKAGKMRKARLIMDKAARKTARQQGKGQANETHNRG